MPTFLLLEEDKVLNTVRGANPPAIKKLAARALRKLEQRKNNEEESEDEAETPGDSNWTMDS
jgi:hypothetical protein